MPHLPTGKTVRRTRFAACWLFAQLVAAFSGFGADIGHAQERAVNIGVLTDMSGLYKDFSGQGSVEAARMAVEDFGGQVLNATI